MFFNPMGPPVISASFDIISLANQAKSHVVIHKLGSEILREKAHIATPIPIVISAPNTMQIQTGMFKYNVNKAELYAPIKKPPPQKKLSTPVYPYTMLYPIVLIL